MHIKNKFIVTIFLFLLNISFIFADNTVISDMPEINLEHDKIVAIQNGPTYIKNISRKMKSPGYWISKLKNPDNVILTKDQIDIYNKSIYNRKIYITNILNYPKTIRKNSFQKQLNKIYKLLSRQKYLNSSLKHVTKKELNNLKNNTRVNITGKYIKTKYAMTINYTDVRLLPTAESFIYNKETFDIDRLQVAGLDIGEPLIVISKSKDKKWAYIVSSHSEGWIKVKDFAYTNYNTICNWIKAKDFVVITETKSDVYLDKQMCNYYDYVRMGAKFPFAKELDDSYQIIIPKADKQNNLSFNKAYILKSEANIGFLHYTQRNIINLAFKHLNSPYSWGGQNGEQDCSTFVRQIFNCFGLNLPRNSSNQIKCGVHPIQIKESNTIKEKSNKIINNSIEAITLLSLQGHIMIYIGNENNSPYVIHAIWGTENNAKGHKTDISFINKIIVSDLFIGQNTSKGSLLERLNSITILKN